MNINATLIGQAITFALFVWFTMRFVWPPIIRAIETREKEIADGLAAAEKGMEREAEAQADAENLIREAKQEAQAIIQRAEKEANAKIEESKANAQAEGQKELEKVQEQIAREKVNAKEDLRQQVSGLAAQGAGRILGKEVDASTHAKLLDDLISQL